MRIFIVFIAVFLTIAQVGLTVASPREDRTSGTLIRIPPPHEESENGPDQGSTPDSATPPVPSPADQMYVFWAVGKLISLPVDIAEACFTRLRQRFTQKPVPVPASGVAENPFTAIERGRVPPAPPVLHARTAR